ncbi:putative fatty acid synthesis protein [Actinoplanes friuliensis DSM 7358]|uniref:Phosphate acyltransferase n=1 Tax=Actinoplanes friuliensis DSM 7358 TaxID=1246995 RepID=U5W983_9ACTN|nr:putative fatty acid synthesis protein [Actinoplanes friuliensis DSM 7358]
MTSPVYGRVAPERRRTSGARAPEQSGRDLSAEAAPEPGIARIAVDLLGGDHAPAVVVDGALRASQADPALQLLLVGPVEAADALLAALDPEARHRVGTITAPAGPGEHDVSRVESGVRTAILAVAQGHADAVVSAGNTGATVTSAALGLGRWPGVRRPPLAAVLPTAAGRLVLLDVGSSVDPDELTLAMHARLGAAYASIVHEVAAPRVGLLTIGTERGKGDRLRRTAPAVLAGLQLPAGARYVGLVEGNDVVTGAKADVVVTDGFTGNVLLKGLETAYALIRPPNDGDVPPRAAILLGVGGTVVVCHGAATGEDVAAGIALAADLHRRAAVPVIADLIQSQVPAHEDPRGGS